MSAELNEIQRAVLRLLCDTFFPSIKVSDDPNGFWARAASDLGVDRVLATALVEDVPPKQRTVLLELLDPLVKQGIANAFWIAFAAPRRQQVVKLLSSRSRRWF